MVTANLKITEHANSAPKRVVLKCLKTFLIFYVMASGGIYCTIYITIHSPNNHLCALDTTLRSKNHLNHLITDLYYSTIQIISWVMYHWGNNKHLKLKE